MRTALIFGVNGQDGSYLAEYLLGLDYVVIGAIRRAANPNLNNLSKVIDSPFFKLVTSDVTDYTSVYRTIVAHRPNEIYNLAAQSHVKVSFDEPFHTTNVVYNGCLNILEAIRMYPPLPNEDRPSFYQASSSEMFGASMGTLFGSPMNGNLANGNAHYRQNEQSAFLPCSPYAIAKLAAHHAVRLYRESYGLHASSGILFNHESERRGEAFVTRKITRYIGKLLRAKQFGASPPLLMLGNLNARRDWGYAPDYVRAMYLMLQQPKAADYVVATGETYTVEDFVREAFACAGIEDWQKYVAISKDLYRPSEVNYLCGDSSRIQALGWKPEVSFKQLVKRMVSHDIEKAFYNGNA